MFSGRFFRGARINCLVGLRIASLSRLDLSEEFRRAREEPPPARRHLKQQLIYLFYFVCLPATHLEGPLHLAGLLVLLYLLAEAARLGPIRQRKRKRQAPVAAIAHLSALLWKCPRPTARFSIGDNKSAVVWFAVFIGRKKSQPSEQI